MTGISELRALADDLRQMAAPTIRVASAAVTDSLCRHCGALVGVAMRRTCGRCPAHHVAVLCSSCTTAQAWGDHGEALDQADRAELRRVAHRVGRVRGAA